MREANLWPTPRATSRMAYHEKPSPSMLKGTHGWSLNAAGNGQSKRKTKQDVANTSNEGLQGTEQHEASVGETETSGTITESFKNDGSQWATEPNVGRVANGVPNRSGPT